MMTFSTAWFVMKPVFIPLREEFRLLLMKKAIFQPLQVSQMTLIQTIIRNRFRQRKSHAFQCFMGSGQGGYEYRIWRKPHHLYNLSGLSRLFFSIVCQSVIT